MRNGNSNSDETSVGDDQKKPTCPRSNMSGISSYCLKTVVMLMLRKNSDPKKWNEANSVELLFEVNRIVNFI